MKNGSERKLVIVVGAGYTRSEAENIKPEYLFNWGKIPGNDNERLIEFLKKNFGIDGIKTEMIKKTDDNRNISVSTEKKSLWLRLNDEKNKVNLKINNIRTYEFIAKMENHKLNIYKSGNLPPLDRTFFPDIQDINIPFAEAVEIETYMKKYYNTDIFDNQNSSLENVMTTIYTDIFQTHLKPEAFKNFLNLIQLFNRYLASTTNKLQPNSQSLLYRILENYLSEYSPEQINIITFNQDIQVEKTLNEVSQNHAEKEAIFNFPHCYKIDYKNLTHPNDKEKDIDTFEKGNSGKECIKLLKLHGSLNWYSRHEEKRLSINSLFKPTRDIYITQRRAISPEMTAGRYYTFPVVVPPIIHKSRIFHNNLIPLWNYAESCLRDATEILLYGYSCPPNDIESTNLLRRAFRKNKNIEAFSIIDPNSSVIKKYIDITGIYSVYWFNCAEKYISSD